MLYLILALSLSTANGPQPANVEKPANAFRAKEVLRVYPTPHEEGSLTVRSAAGDALQFYLFDAEGTLVYQSEIKGRNLLTVEGLLPGAYTYHAFRADEKLKGGTVAIKTLNQ